MSTENTEKNGKKVAVVGAGYWGKNLVRNFSELGALAAVCDSDRGAVAGFVEKYGCRGVRDYADILEDDSIQAVALATPAETHGAMVKEALLAGKDVFVEKPLCLSPVEGRELVDLAAAADLVLMVGHLLWYHPAVLKLKSLVEAGELGRIQYIYSNRLNMGKIRREENILWSFAPHDISVILGLLGETPDKITAQGGNYLHQHIEDVTVSLLSFPSGVKAHIFVSWLHPFKEQKLVVVGDRKMAVFNDVEKEDKLLLYPHTIEWKNQMPVANKAEAQRVDFVWDEPLKAECQHFLDRLADRAAPRTDGAEGLRVLSVLQQCQEALDGGAEDRRADAKNTPYFAHESAFIDPGTAIGKGTRIWHVSHIMKGSRIGENCRIGRNVVIGPDAVVGDNVKIQNNVSVYKGVTLEDDVFCGPSMVFTNVINPRSAVPRMDELKPTLVRRGATIGAGAVIVCGTVIGRHAFIGAGAVVTKDVPAYALVYGNPAQVHGWVCECGLKLDFAGRSAACACGRAYSKTAAGVEPAAADKEEVLS